MLTDSEDRLLGDAVLILRQVGDRASADGRNFDADMIWGQRDALTCVRERLRNPNYHGLRSDCPPLERQPCECHH